MATSVPPLFAGWGSLGSALPACRPLFPVALPSAQRPARLPQCLRQHPVPSASDGSSTAVQEAGEGFTSPKTGAVGEARFRSSAAPGTYWASYPAPMHAGSAEGSLCVTVEFDTGAEMISLQARVGDNLLRLAEQSGAMTPTEDFCFEGTCCHCEMEVEGGATEVGYRAYSSSGDLVRSCICPVPYRESGTLRARILSEEGAWGEGVL